MLTNLKYLNIEENVFQKVDCKQNLELEELIISKNQLQQVDIKMLNNLKVLEMCDLPITKLDLRSCPAL